MTSPHNADTCQHRDCNGGQEPVTVLSMQWLYVTPDGLDRFTLQPRSKHVLLTRQELRRMGVLLVEIADGKQP